MIHIVRYRAGDKSILSRKAQFLATELGWTIGDSSDPGAFLNYAFPYLDYRGDTPLPFAAYFTHREDGRPGKVKIWEDRARKAVLRVTSAQQYYDDLSQYGPTVKIMPPLDRDKFKIIRYLKRNTLPKVGVAGFVYQGGRKGEHLLATAARSTSESFEFKAIGSGWPIPTVNLPYEKLHEFYHAIDIYLCTSLIEGIPYPPLEALACGKKIVVPKGVGIMDELPDINGIERYDAGDYGSMIEALHRAVEITAHPEELRAVTEVFSVENWVEEHAKAFAEYEQAFMITSKKESRARKSNRGIYVVAFGNAARKCSRRLLNSVRQQMPDTQIAIVADRSIPEADYSIEFKGEIDGGARRAKLGVYDLAPESWDQVLYLDADTELIESVEPIFQALSDGWEMVFVKDANSRATVPFLKRKKNLEEYNETLEFIGSEEEIVICGGVFAFKRSPGAKRFMKQWQDEWGQGRYRDQPSMLRAYYKAKVKALILGSEWNCFTGHRQENRFEIVRHYSGGTARNQPVAQFEQVTVVNTSDRAIERAGLLFMPHSPVLVNPNAAKFGEIKGCSLLTIIR